jgi:GT2 family glycosyltransferase
MAIEHHSAIAIQSQRSDVVPQQPTLSVVIVAWNGRALVERCLRHLLASQGVTFDVTVVDNASTERPDVLAPVFPTVRFDRCERNVGFAAGNNRALKEAKGRHVLLLNPDCFVEPDMLRIMVAFLQTHHDVGAVGPLLTYENGSLQYSAFRDVTPATLLWEYFLLDERWPGNSMAGRYEARDYAHARIVDGILGACLLVRGGAAAEVGWLDERFYMYCEEVDWCRRLRKHGWTIWQQPRARAVHLAGASTATVYGAMFVALHQSRFLLYALYETPIKATVMRTITKAGLCYQLAYGVKEFLRGRLALRQLRQRTRTFRAVLQL